MGLFDILFGNRGHGFAGFGSKPSPGVYTETTKGPNPHHDPPLDFETEKNWLFDAHTLSGWLGKRLVTSREGDIGVLKRVYVVSKDGKVIFDVKPTSSSSSAKRIRRQTQPQIHGDDGFFDPDYDPIDADVGTEAAEAIEEGE